MPSLDSTRVTRKGNLLKRLSGRAWLSVRSKPMRVASKTNVCAGCCDGAEVSSMNDMCTPMSEQYSPRVRAGSLGNRVPCSSSRSLAPKTTSEPFLT